MAPLAPKSGVKKREKQESISSVEEPPAAAVPPVLYLSEMNYLNGSSGLKKIAQDKKYYKEKTTKNLERSKRSGGNSVTPVVYSLRKKG